MSEKILLALMPYWNPLIPPMGLACLKSYLERFGIKAKIIDANVEPKFQEVIDRYFEALKAILPLERQGNFYNQGNEVLRHHFMAYFRNRNHHLDKGLVNELVKQNFFTTLASLRVVELNRLVEEFFKRLNHFVGELIEKEKPAVLGLSTYTVNLPATLYTFQLAKSINPQIKTVMGGGIFTGEMEITSPNFKDFAKETPYIDKIIVGEGELLFLAYLQGKLPVGKRIYTLADIQGETLDLQQAPLPDFSGLETQYYTTLASYTSRSCPFHCSFCSEKVYWGKFRRKSGKQIVHQLVQLMEKYKTQLFLMADSLLNPVIDEVATEVKAGGYSLYWDGYLRAEDAVGDSERVSRWRAGGFYRARLGLESGSSRILEAMGKRITPVQIKQAVTALAKAGIKTTTYWVIGYPGETESDFQQTLDLITEMKDDIYEADCNPFIYYLTGQVQSEYWAEEKKAHPLYPKEMHDLLLLQDWVLDTPPSREETFSRINRFIRHCQELGIPNPYRLIDIYQADKRWERLHPNAAPPLAEFINAKNSQQISIGEKKPGKKSARYWLEKFSGGFTKTVFPYDTQKRIKNNNEFSKASIPIRLTHPLYEVLLKVSNRSDVRLHIILVAGWFVLLHKYTESTDITVGIPVNSPASVVQKKNSLLPLRNKVATSMTVKELLLQLGQQVLEANQNQDYSFEVLLEQLNLSYSNENNPLFDLSVALEEIHGENDRERNSQNLVIIYRKAAQTIEGCVEYNPGRYRESTIETLVNQYNCLLDSMLLDVTASIQTLEIMSHPEKKKILEEFSSTSTEMVINGNVVENLQYQLIQNPDRIALVGEMLKSTGVEISISYREMLKNATQWATWLTEKGARSETIVAVMMERSLEMVTAILGIWTVGAAYLPMEPDNPPERTAYMLKDSGAEIVVTSDVRLETSSISVLSVSSVANSLFTSSLAYIIYTSGSTGRPKGAMVEHRGMMNHLQAKIQALEITEQTFIAQESPHTFDISVWQFFAALNQGGKTIIYPGEVLLEPNRFLLRLEQNQVTILEVVPSYLNALLETIQRSKRIPSLVLTHLLVTGEETKPHLVTQWFDYYPTIRITNAYGPTEASDDITHHLMEFNSFSPEILRIPIGKPIPNLTIYIVNEQMNLTPIGITGEILVSGIGVGRGYMNNPQLTLEKFCLRQPGGTLFEKTAPPGPPGKNFLLKSDSHTNLRTNSTIYKTGDLGRWLPTGEIEFFGRKDQQVKIRGFRIELGEIENRLRNYSKIKEAVIIDRLGQSNKKYLCAYIIGDAPKTKLKEFLAQTLPDYMIPTCFVTLNRFPLTPNGKIDRKALPEPQEDTGSKGRYISAKMLHQAVAKLPTTMPEPLQEEQYKPPHLSDQEMQALLYTFNDSDSYYPADKTIVSLFLEQAGKTPDYLAVKGGSFRENRPPNPPAKAFDKPVHDDVHLTYNGVEEKTMGLAKILRENGVSIESIAGIMAERTPALLIGMMAIMTAGGVYLALSPTYPAKRTAIMCYDSGMTLALVDPFSQIQVSGLQTITLDMWEKEKNDKKKGNLIQIQNPGNSAAIFYTSGTTGRPKGVVLEHRGLVNRLYWQNLCYPFGPNGVTLQKTSTLFDVSMAELFGWAICGASVYLMPPHQESNPSAIIESISRGQVTHIHFIPAALVQFLHHLETTGIRNRLNTLKYVFASGEELTAEMVNRFNQLIYPYSGAAIHNLYGPTEASIEVSYYDCPVNKQVNLVPIGRPISNTRLYILGPDLGLLPIGVAGELCIAGVGLARGYLNHPELTEQRFHYISWNTTNNPYNWNKITKSFCGGLGGGFFKKSPQAVGDKIYRTGDLARWQPDGNIEFLGRKDQQVQVGGIRVEPGEIESILLRQPGIKASAVVPRKDNSHYITLCAFVELSGETDIPALKRNLAKELPPHMLPANIIEVEQFPFTATGKIHRKVLETIDINFESTTKSIAPRNQKENQVAAIWREVLNKDRIGIHDNFFDSGGNSLGIIQVNVRMKEVFQREIPALILFEYPTIAALAEYLERQEKSEHREHRGQGNTSATVQFQPGTRPEETANRKEIKNQGRQRMRQRRENVGQKTPQ